MQPPNKPSICFVSRNIYPVLARDPDAAIVGGAEVQQSILARALAAAGHRVSIVCADQGQAEGTIVDGVTVHRTYREGEGIRYLRAFHPNITSVWRALARANSDIYYQRSRGLITGVVAAYCRFARRPFVFSAAHDFDFTPPVTTHLKPYARAVSRWALSRADRVVVQNASQRVAAAGLGLETVAVNSCYDPPRGSSVSPDGYVLWASRVTRLKRPDRFFELASRLPQFSFRFVGGPGLNPGDEALFRDLRERAAAIPNLEFVGFVPYGEIEPHFDGARLFVNTSIAEGFPNAFLQAWARGMPTVSLVRPESAIDGGFVGHAVEDEDHLVRTVEGLMSDDVRWSESGARCKQYFFERHSLDRTLRSYMDLFSQLLADGRFPPPDRCD